MNIEILSDLVTALSSADGAAAASAIVGEMRAILWIKLDRCAVL